MRVFRLAALILTLAACAPVTQLPPVDPAAAQAEQRLQAEMAVESLIENNRRLAEVGWPLLAAAVPMCGDEVAPLAGFLPLSRYTFDGLFRDAAERSYGLGDLPAVMFVVDGLPAEDAGMRAGDVIAAVNGKPLTPGRRSVDDLLAELERAGRNRVTLALGGGEPRSVSFTPVPACDYSVTMKDDDAVNAFADGSKVSVTSGMMRFAADDDDLALVVSHEIAHNAMGHLTKQFGNQFLGAIVDGVIQGLFGVNTGGAGAGIAGRAFSKQFEAEADYVGLYIMARAGREIGEAPRFWRRMGALSPRSISLATTHPTSPERFVGLTSSVREIEAKRRRGEPLLPNLR